MPPYGLDKLRNQWSFNRIRTDFAWVPDPRVIYSFDPRSLQYERHVFRLEINR
jgi:hypothetical protein